MSSDSEPYDSADEVSVASGSGSEPGDSNHESEAEVDISSSLAGPKAREKSLRNKHDDGDDDVDDAELANLIQASIAKRNIKSGTDVLKKSKGKTKLVKGEVGGGSFQSMGLHPWLLRSLTLQGYRTPTPIQRLAIPALLQSPPRDLVGMARTGSGKSLAYMIPLVQRLGGAHATAFGARALILLPTRELALQVLKVGKELARGWHAADGGDHAGAKDGPSSKSKGLRWALVVGGEGLDEQFEMISSNPDVIIATPGRLLHLVVEMNLDLKSASYVVFDEADRLFEMGFETALTELLSRLPAARQTLLFSATLPKSLVEFARAGLSDPKLVRLDAESKLSTDLRMAFFSVKPAEKDAALLSLLRDVIRVPLAREQATVPDAPADRKGKRPAHAREAAPHQTLVFAATKHHVEYLQTLLRAAGYAVAAVYGALDQTARGLALDAFRRGTAAVLVVTDVAARGIDIPLLAHVVNYDFPHGARVFVHRVGRTARAGRAGWAWSLVGPQELPFLLDLELFLARPLAATLPDPADDGAYMRNLVLGPLARERLDAEVEYARGLDAEDGSLPALRAVMRKGQSMYERSRGKASQASYRRAKEMSRAPGKWGLAGAGELGAHPVLLRHAAAEEAGEAERRRRALMEKVNAFRPAETVLEARGKAAVANENAALMRSRRTALLKAQKRAEVMKGGPSEDEEAKGDEEAVKDDDEPEMADEAEIEAVFGPSKKRKREPESYRDEEFYMSHYQKDAATDKGYSLRDGASFVEQARGATFDLATDEAVQAQKRAGLGWDKKKKKFVAGGGAGADNVKIVRTESGTRLPASYRSGRFDEWKAKHRARLPKIGEDEGDAGRFVRGGGGGGAGTKFRHSKMDAAKPLDKLGNNYERKSRQMKKRAGDASASTGDTGEGRGGRPFTKGSHAKGVKEKTPQGRAGGRYGGKPIGRVKSELKSAEQIRKARKTQDQRKSKNARPSKRGRR